MKSILNPLLAGLIAVAPFSSLALAADDAETSVQAEPGYADFIARQQALADKKIKFINELQEELKHARENKQEAKILIPYYTMFIGATSWLGVLHTVGVDNFFRGYTTPKQEIAVMVIGIAGVVIPLASGAAYLHIKNEDIAKLEEQIVIAQISLRQKQETLRLLKNPNVDTQYYPIE